MVSMERVCLERAVRLYVQQVRRSQIEVWQVSQIDSTSHVTKLQHANMHRRLYNVRCALQLPS